MLCSVWRLAFPPVHLRHRAVLCLCVPLYQERHRTTLPFCCSAPNYLQVSLALDPRYFALRWFTTLLSREFDLPDTIRLWDSLFAAKDRSAFLVFVFVTLLMAQRETLLAGDFASNLQLLQAYPPTDVPDILAQSEALRLFSARGDAARAGELAEQRAREVADGAKQAAEQVNAAARRLWSAASDLAAGAAERVVAMNDVTYTNGFSGGGVVQAEGVVPPDTIM